MPLRFFWVLLIFGFCAGCANLSTSLREHGDDFDGHYLLVHKGGQPLVLPEEGFPPLSTSSKSFASDAETCVAPPIFQKQTEIMTQKIRSRLTKLAPHCKENLRLLVFMHGGLNGYDDTVERMVEYLIDNKDKAQDGEGAKDGEGATFIKDHTNSCYYPFFVGWNSAALSSLGDDLVLLRSGTESPAVGVVTAPIVLGSRLVSAIGNSPIALAHTVASFRQQMAREPYDGFLGGYDALLYAPVTALWGITNAPFQGLGTGMWQVMKRRAELTVASSLPNGENAEGEAYEGLVVEKTTCGAVKLFFGKLAGIVSDLRDEGHNVTVTVAGHSMGAFLLDRIVAVYGDTLPIDNIVYLAPASSIDEVQHTVFPYLERNQGKSPSPRLWIFTLNRRDEAREIAMWQAILFPRGSLLTWIDRYFESNNTPIQRTAGNAENFKDLNLGNLSPSAQARDRFCKDLAWSRTATDFKRASSAFPALSDQVFLYNAVRKVGIIPKVSPNNAPEEHGNFTAPRFFGQILCRIDPTAFANDFCGVGGAEAKVLKLKPKLNKNAVDSDLLRYISSDPAAGSCGNL